MKLSTILLVLIVSLYLGGCIVFIPPCSWVKNPMMEACVWPL